MSAGRLVLILVTQTRTPHWEDLRVNATISGTIIGFVIGCLAGIIIGSIYKVLACSPTAVISQTSAQTPFVSVVPTAV